MEADAAAADAAAAGASRDAVDDAHYDSLQRASGAHLEIAADGDARPGDGGRVSAVAKASALRKTGSGRPSTWFNLKTFTLLSGVCLLSQMLAFSVQVATITTVQTAFGLTTSDVGTWFSSYTAGEIVSGVLVSYFAGQSRTPRVLAAAMLVTGVGCFAHAAPHVLYGSRGKAGDRTSLFADDSAAGVAYGRDVCGLGISPSGPTTMATDGGNGSSQPAAVAADDSCSSESSTTYWATVLYAVAGVVLGLGYGPIPVLPMAYIDNNAGTKNEASLYQENNIVIHDQPGYNDPLLNCQLVVGYRSVYAVCFGMVMFFAFMALLMVCVKSSRDPRAGIQNGFWLFKFLAFIGAIVGGFFILQLELFPTVWMYFGLIGGFLFILIQLLLLVDFAFAWNEKFLERFEETQHKGWYAGLLVFTILFYLVILAAVILFYLFYANGDCSLHKFFVSFNLILVVIMSIVAVLPKIQEKNPRSGLLQPALIGAYIMYLTWGAMSSNPDKTCNPTLLEIFIDVNQTATYGTTSSITAANSIRQQLDGVSILTLLIFMVAVLYASIRNSSHSSVGKLTLSGGRNHERVVLGEEAGSSIEKKKGNDEDESRVYDNESDGVAYNYSFLHVMLALASFYIMMTLTNWYKPNLHNGVFTLQTSEPAMWVKISSSWVCVLFFLWTLIAPVALPNRDFN